MSYNLDWLLKSRYHVDSVKYTGDSTKQYWCRDLPHSTVISVLSHVFESMNDNDALKQFNMFMETTDKGDDETEHLLRSFIPVLRKLCLRGDTVVNRILCDVVEGMSEKHAPHVPIEDTLAIIDEAVSRVDMAVLASLLRKVFSRAVQIGGEVPPKAETMPPPNLKEASTPSSSSAEQHA